MQGADFQKYGGGTSCYLIRLAGETVVVDAGTGLSDLPRFLSAEQTRIQLLLTHGHVDHLLGFPLCPCILQRDYQFDVYAKTRNGLDAEKQIATLMSPPLWPVTPGQMPARIVFHELQDKMVLGELLIESLEGVHPNGVSILRLTGGGKRIVLMTDCTITPERRSEFLAFAQDCDLLLCDGQYSPEEWETRDSFGHNSWTAAARFGQDCGAVQVRIIHHDPAHTDEQLNAATEMISVLHPRCTFGKGGEELIL